VNSFKNRLLILIVSLMALAQGVTMALALASIRAQVRSDSVRQLVDTRAMLETTLTERSRRLHSAADVLVRDYGFKEAVASADQVTIQSALGNHAQRVGADLAVLYSLAGEVISANTPQLAVQARHSLRLVDSEEQTAAFAPFALIGGHPYQIVLAPLRAPQVVGWVALGFALDRALAQQLATLAGTDVSIVFREPGADSGIISTLTPTPAHALAGTTTFGSASAAPFLVTLGGTQYLALSAPLRTQGGSLQLIAQQSQDAAMTPFRQMRMALLLIGGAALVAAIAVALLVSRSAARPLNMLVKAAQQIERGYYCESIQVAGGSEFQHLAGTLSGMATSIREREARIVHQANHDALTGLPNREGLRERLAALPPGEPFSAVMLDVQRFRDINASVGHLVGDQLLGKLAVRLGQLGGGALLCARVGADQFVALCALHDSELLHRVLQLSDELRAGIVVDALRLCVDVRAGISEWRAPRVSVGDFLRQVDVALLQAKEQDTVAVVYQASHDADHRRRVLLVAELRQALNGEGLSLNYQPLVNMPDRAVVGFEALLRWSHPTLGSISPAEFIPLAERASVLPALSRWVLSAAIEQLGQWQRLGLEIELSVNLSAADFADGELAARVLELLRLHQVPAAQLLLEVTESAIMREPQLAAQVMQQLRMAGVRFAIDDFGTGHSSLAQLHALPVDELKIDRGFVGNLDQSAGNLAIVRTTIELGHSLGLKVVAEGIETPEVWASLLRLGCDLAQGYFISRPMAAGAVPEWLRGQRAQLTQAFSVAEQAGVVASLRGRSA